MDQEPQIPEDLQALLGTMQPPEADAPGVDPIIQQGLLEACVSGDLASVQQAVAAGADVNESVEGYKRKKKPINIAAAKGHLHIIKWLIEEAHADPMQKNEIQFTGLHNACEKGRLEIVKFFIEELKFPVDLPAVNDLQPLHVACLYSRTEVVKYLASKGASLTDATKFGSTPMYLACNNKDDPTIKFLIEQKVDCNVGNSEGVTPLHLLVRHGHMTLVKLLVEEGGADISREDKAGRTPLDEADVNSMSEVAVYLWRKGAEPSGKVSELKTDLVCSRPFVFNSPNGRASNGFCSDGGSKIYSYGGFGLPPSFINHDPLNDLKETRGQILDDFNMIDLDEVQMKEIIPFSERQPHRGLKLSPTDKGPFTKLLPDGLTAEAEYPNEEVLAQYQNDSIIRADAPFRRTDGFGYFEVLIIDPGVSRIVTVGLTNEGYDVTKQPGWMKDSYGFHGDDGNLFHNRGRGINFGERFYPGDIIGCGVSWADEGFVFFTKNGQFLGAPFRGPQSNAYWATIGIANDKAKFKANFGTTPFRFNFQVPCVSWTPLKTTMEVPKKKPAAAEGEHPAAAAAEEEEEEVEEETKRTGPGPMPNPILLHLADRNELLLIGADIYTLNLSTLVWKKVASAVTGGLHLNSCDRMRDDPNIIIIFATARIPVAQLRRSISIPVLMKLDMSTWDTEQILPPGKDSNFTPEMHAQSRKTFETMRTFEPEAMMVVENDELCFVGDANHVILMNIKNLEFREVEIHGHGLDVVRPGIVKYSDMQVVTFGGYYKSKDLPANEVTFLDIHTQDAVKPHLTGVCVPRPRDGAQSALMTLSNPLLTGSDIDQRDEREALAATKRQSVKSIIHAFGTIGNNYIHEFDLIMLGKPRRADELNDIFGSETLSDLVVKVKDVSFPCHRAVLWARSTYFKELLTANPKMGSVSIDDASPLLVEELLRLLYSDRVNLAVVDKYGFREFIAVLERYAPNHAQRVIEERLLTKLSGESSMSADISALFKNELFADITFRSHDRTQQAIGHKAILCTRSAYFNAMFFGGLRESGQNEIVLPEDTDFEAFLLALEFIYSKNVDHAVKRIEEDEGTLIIELFDLACRYGLRKLKQELENIISYNVTPDNVCTLLIMADQHHALILRSHCVSFINQNRAAVEAEEDYQSQQEPVESLLRSLSKA